MKYLRVIEIRYKDELLINLRNISVVVVNSQSILVNGVHGEATGWYSFDEENFKKILNAIKEYEIWKKVNY